MTTETTISALAGLSDLQIYQLSRLAVTRIEFRRGWSSGSLRTAFEGLEARGFVASTSSPKGKFNYYTITDNGRVLLPAVLEHQRRREAGRLEAIARAEAAEVVRAAAPDLLAALEAVLSMNALSEKCGAVIEARAALKKAGR